MTLEHPHNPEKEGRDWNPAFGLSALATSRHRPCPFGEGIRGSACLHPEAIFSRRPQIRVERSHKTYNSAIFISMNGENRILCILYFRKSCCILGT